MDSIDKGIQAIRKQGILPLFYHSDLSLCVEMTRTLYQAGIRVVEFTNRGENAFENFKALQQLKESECPELLLAIGTIKSPDQAVKFIDAGADMLISPVFDADVADVAYLHKKLWIPGCMTPTEMHQAQKAGCRLVKLFPGNVLGPGFVSGVKDLFPDLLMMPTGGVEVEAANLKAWFDAGVCAVGLGSKVITKTIMEQRDLDSLRANITKAINLVQEIRPK